MIYIVDGNYLTYRAFCASSGSRESVHRAGISIPLDLANTGSVWVVWDKPDGTGADLRRKDYELYKVNREPKNHGYYAAVSDLRDVFPSMGINQATPVMGEGDDAAATLCWRFENSDKVTLWTRDKDWLQLLKHPSVTMIRPSLVGLGVEDEISHETVESIIGIPPELVTSYLAIVGDAADGFPGIQGVGKKRALSILRAEPAFVDLVVAGKPDVAVRSVASKDASAVKWARLCATRGAELLQMYACATLRRVPLAEIPGTINVDSAAAALETIGASWAIDRVRYLAPDDWS